jgi:hypothetical protein
MKAAEWSASAPWLFDTLLSAGRAAAALPGRHWRTSVSVTALCHAA